MTIPGNDPNIQQYNNDLNQYKNDAWMMNPANPNGYPAQWKQLIQELKGLHGSRKAVEHAMQIIEFKLLGPTLIDGYDQMYGKVKGDLMSLTSDVGVLENKVSGFLTDSKTKPLTNTQAAAFSTAMQDLYSIFNSQKSAGAKSQWLTANGAQNGLTYIGGLYQALGITDVGGIISTAAADKMATWWSVTKNPKTPNANLKLFQDNLQSLSGIGNSINQAASTEESLNNNNMNSTEAVLKGILTSLTSLETKINQGLSSG